MRSATGALWDGNDFEIYEQAKQYLLDDETMQDVIAFKAERKEFVKNLRAKFQGKIVQRPENDPVPLVRFVKASIKEMTTDKPLDRSVRLGCSVAEYKEAAMNSADFARQAKWKASRPGGEGRHTGESNVKNVHTLEHPFISKASGNSCVAVFSVHEYAPDDYRAHFMYTKRSVEEQ